MTEITLANGQRVKTEEKHLIVRNAKGEVVAKIPITTPRGKS